MLMALGFLLAALLALTIAPAFWARAVRLTTQRIKERLPVTETEIRADKDRLRAEFAMTVHRLESKIEQADLKRARHLIDLNRRDAEIAKLESEVTTLRSSVEEFENARRVLEHTVSERLPKVESRLSEARSLLATRDTEINDLSSSTSRQQQALDEARSINSQQAAEIDRLTTSLTVRGGRNQHSLKDPNFSGEVALRAEIEGLRAKTRDQASLVARLQQTAAQQAAEAPAAAANGRGNGLAQVEAAFNLATLQPPDEVRTGLERALHAIRAKADDQAVELKTLTAELTALRNADAAETPDSKVALRARLTGLQTQSDQQAEIVRKLRAELAAANERLALQGAHFMEQMRKLGAGTLPASGQPRRADAAGLRVSLAERVAQSRGPQTASVTALPVNGAAAAREGDSDEHGEPGGATPRADTKPAASGSGSGRLIDRISSLSKA